jgi:protocatechuate 3,4-dioxygenase beta subunit
MNVRSRFASLVLLGAVASGLSAGIGQAQSAAPPPPRPTPAPATAPAPAQQAPARDVAPPQIGSSALAGLVVADDGTNRIVRRVVVTLSGGNLRMQKMTLSDEQGRFVFLDLPAGRYTLQADKPGFVSSFYGARKPWRGPGQPIALDPGQRKTDVVFKLQRGAVITGTVRDPSGQPQSGLRVQVLQNRMMNGEMGWAGNGGGNTDDRGMYRIYGLAPGTYIVGVTGTPISTAARITNDAEVQWALAQAQTATRTGVAPGADPGAPEPGPVVGYSPLYFPGTVEPDSATQLTIGAGEERGGIDLTMQFVPTARVSGVVTSVDGQPAPGVQIMLTPVSTRRVNAPFENPLRSTTDGNGRFMIQAVRPGPYTLAARSIGGPDVRSYAMAGIDGGFAQFSYSSAYPQVQAPIANGLWAQADINVAGRDLTNVALTLQTGMTITGRVAFEGTKPPPADLSKMTIAVRMAPNQLSIGPLPTGTVTADGRFTISGVAPGRYILGNGPASGGPPPTAGFTLKSVVVKGQDTLDYGFDVQPNESVSDGLLTFTDQLTTVTGRLINGAGEPVKDYFVLIFPTDKSYWTNNNRRMRPAIRTQPDGRFATGNLPAGEYFMAALTDFDQNDLYDPGFLDQVAAAAFKITLAEGEKKNLDLKIGGGS